MMLDPDQRAALARHALWQIPLAFLCAAVLVIHGHIEGRAPDWSDAGRLLVGYWGGYLAALAYLLARRAIAVRAARRKDAR